MDKIEYQLTLTKRDFVRWSWEAKEQFIIDLDQLIGKFFIERGFDSHGDIPPNTESKGE